MTATPELMPFHAMEIMRHAKAAEAAGRSICHLEVGEPGAPPAPKVLEAVRRALPDPQGYTMAKGTRELREALVRYYDEQHGVAADCERIIATMGSSAGFILAFHAAFRPGARIAITRPGYPAYVNTLIGLGFEVVEIPVTAASGWLLTGADIEKAHGEQPFDGLLFASPANPTGAAVDRAGLTDIVEACRRLGVRLISDEIYHGLDYGAGFHSALEVTDEVFVINSFSKYFSMTGWRVGWMVVPDSMIRTVERIAQNMFICPPHASQVAALAALDCVEEAEANLAVYAENRRLMLERLPRIGFDRIAPPEGAFYIYADVSDLTEDSLRFAAEILEKAGVAVTPGLDFDPHRGARTLRFSYAAGTAEIAEGLDRLAAFMAAR